MFNLIIGASVGLVFGFAVEKSKVFEPVVMVGQLLLKRFIMLKVFMSAMLTSAIGLYSLHLLGYFEFQLNPMNIPLSVFGGGLLGVGIALTGACPGMMFAQLGAGYRDAWFMLLGGLFGTFAFWGNIGCIDSVFKHYSTNSLQLHQVLDLPIGIVYVALCLIILSALWGMEKISRWKGEVQDL